MSAPETGHELRPEKLRSLRREFTTIIFSVMTIALLASIAALFVITKLIPVHRTGLGFFLPGVLLFVISSTIATVLTVFVGNKFLRPVIELSRASEKVAKGDFSVRLDESSDVDELRTALKNFNTMVMDLGATETLSSDFIANVSHEFKTPLAAIEGYAMLLQDPSLTEEERKEYAEKILLNSTRLSDLAGNILLLSKLENQRFEPTGAPFSLDEQIREEILVLEPKWSGKDLALDVDLETVQYAGNAGLLRQVWLNLMSNAVKFTPSGGSITVTLEKEESRICFTITDTGTGMSEETLPHIFEKFYQGDTSRRSEGNGLGLSLTKRILDVCGGSIEVSSTPGVGSTFRVYLPFTEEEDA